jgi:hypothetical protein
MPYNVKAVIKQENSLWSAAIPSLDLNTTGHKSLERCLDTLTPMIAWKVSQDFGSTHPVTAKINTMAVRVEFEIDVERNHSLEEFVAPVTKGKPPTAPPEQSEENCHECEHYSSKNTVKESCPRKDELLFRGGTKTGAQLIQDTVTYGCHVFTKKTDTLESVKESVKATDDAVAAAKTEAGKAGKKKKRRPSIRACPDDCPNKKIVPEGKDKYPQGRCGHTGSKIRDMHACPTGLLDKEPTGTPMPAETCDTCEAADICQQRDPRAGCLSAAIAAESARKAQRNKKPSKKKGATNAS